MELKDAQYKKMTEQPVSRLILSLAVPTIISMMVTAVYNTAGYVFCIAAWYERIRRGRHCDVFDGNYPVIGFSYWYGSRKLDVETAR